MAKITQSVNSSAVGALKMLYPDGASFDVEDLLQSLNQLAGLMGVLVPSSAVSVIPSLTSLAVDNTKPTFISASTNTDGTKVVLSYSEALNSMTAAKSAFLVRVGGVAVTVNSVAVNGSTVELSLANIIKSGSSITVGYTAPTTSKLPTNFAIQDIAGNDAISLPLTTRVANNSSIDGMAPSVVSFSPADAAKGVSISSNLVLTFSELIQKGTGTIQIRSGSTSGPVFESFDAASSGRLNFSGNQLTIDPTNNMASGTHYYVTVAKGTVKDLAGNAYAGSSTYDFTTLFDKTAPTVVAFNPADAATGVSVTSNMVITFSEAIQKGTGTIQIRYGSATGSVIESFDAATSNRLNFSGNQLTIDPTKDLPGNTHYYLTFAAGSVKDLVGNAYAGGSSYDFTTAADTTAPTVVAFNPSDNATAISVGSNLVLTFSEAVTAGTGNIYIYKSDGTLVNTIGVTDSSQVSFLGNVVTINPSTDLAYASDYYVNIENSAIKDIVGNVYAGISNSTSYNFHTEDNTAASFNIKIAYSGNSAYQTYFQQAAQNFQKIILNDVPDVSYNGTLIDDLLINASVVSIDGAGGILGQAGPQLFRSGSDLPYLGLMQFDSADVASMVSSGIFTDVVVHEMAHVLGFGTIWSDLGLNKTFGQYTGACALAEYRSISGNSSATYVPLETVGGSGTVNCHWSESVFDREIMTGYAEKTGDMPLSRLTIAAFQDLGYTVDYSQAEPYVVGSALTSLVQLTGTPTVDPSTDPNNLELLV